MNGTVTPSKVLLTSLQCRCVFYLQEATLSALLAHAVLAGLQFLLQVAQSVGQQLLVQLVVVAFLTRQQELLLQPRRLVQIEKSQSSMSNTGLSTVTLVTEETSGRECATFAPLPPVSSDSCDFCPVRSERCFRDAALPASPAVLAPSAPPAEP